MKRFFFILLLMPMASFCQTNFEFIFQQSLSDQWGDNCISKMDCFYFTLDSALIFSDDDIYDYYYTLYYSYGQENRQAIANGYWEDLGYNSILNCFKNERDNSYVIFWEFEHEYYPIFNAYYIHEGKILKIGEWIISIPSIKYHCEYCDYSMEDIQIHKKNNEIEFSFLADTNFVIFTENFDYDNWGTFQARELIVSFNIVDGTVKRVEKK